MCVYISQWSLQCWRNGSRGKRIPVKIYSDVVISHVWTFLNFPFLSVVVSLEQQAPKKALLGWPRPDDHDLEGCGKVKGDGNFAPLQHRFPRFHFSGDFFSFKPWPVATITVNGWGEWREMAILELGCRKVVSTLPQNPARYGLQRLHGNISDFFWKENQGKTVQLHLIWFKKLDILRKVHNLSEKLEQINFKNNTYMLSHVLDFCLSLDG